MSAPNENGSDRVSDLVPWLQGLALPPDPRRAPPGAEPAAELPHWLDGLTDLPVAGTQPRSANLPAWLAGLDADDALVSGRAGSIQHAPQQAPPSAWRTRQTAEQAAPVDGVPPMPDWLARLAARRRDATQGKPDAAGAGSAESQLTGVDAPGAAVVGNQASETGVPAWLKKELDQPIGTPRAADTPDRQAGEFDAAPRAADSMPTLDWLRDIEEAWAADAERMREALSRPERVEPDNLSVDLPPLDALVPEWMQPAEPRRSPPPPDPARAILQRAGLLPSRTESGPTTQAARVVARRSPETQAAVDLMALLAAQDAVEPTLTAAASPPLWQRVQVHLASVMLLVAVIAVVLLQPAFPLPVVTPPGTVLRERVAALGPEQTVIVAMEWGAQRVPQLQPQVDELMDLLAQREVQVVLLSTDPSGAVLGARLLAQSASAQAGPKLQSLGYLPGADMAVRALSTDFGPMLATAIRRTTDAAAQAETVASPTAVFVVADQLADVQLWLEQWWVRQPNVPLTFLVTPDVAAQAVSFSGAENVAVVTAPGNVTAAGPDPRLIHASFALALLIGLAAALAARRAARLRGDR